jgi:hypothetical protein
MKNLLRGVLCFCAVSLLYAQERQHTYTVLPDVTRTNTGTVEFQDLAQTHKITFQSANSIAADVNFTWPPADAHGCLVSDGSGHLTVDPSCTAGASGQPFTDALPLIFNAADPTKLVQFDVSSVPTSTTYLLVVPTLSGTSATFAFLGQVQTFSHVNTFNQGIKIGPNGSFIFDGPPLTIQGDTATNGNILLQPGNVAGNSSVIIENPRLDVPGLIIVDASGTTTSDAADFRTNGGTTYWKVIAGTDAGCPGCEVTRSQFPFADATYTLGDSGHSWLEGHFRKTSVDILIGTTTAGTGISIETTGGGDQVNIGIDFIDSLKNAVTGKTTWALAGPSGFGALRLSDSSGSGGLDTNGAQILATAIDGNVSAMGGFLARSNAFNAIQAVDAGGNANGGFFGAQALVRQSGVDTQIGTGTPGTGLEIAATGGGSNLMTAGWDFVNSLKNGVAGDTIWALAQFGNFGLLRLSDGSGSGGVDTNGAQILLAAQDGSITTVGNVQARGAAFNTFEAVDSSGNPNGGFYGVQALMYQDHIFTQIGSTVGSVTGLKIYPDGFPADQNQLLVGVDFITSLKNGTAGDTIFALAQDGSNNAVLRLSNGSGSGGFDGNGAQIYATASNGTIEAINLVLTGSCTGCFNNLGPLTITNTVLNQPTLTLIDAAGTTTSNGIELKTNAGASYFKVIGGTDSGAPGTVVTKNINPFTDNTYSSGEINHQWAEVFTHSISAPVSIFMDFNGQPNGTIAIPLTYNFPGPRGTNVYYGLRADIADTLVDGSSAFSVFNNGTADAMYIEPRGASSGVTTPTGIGMRINHIAGAQNNPNFAGFGIQLWDYTSAATGGIPLLIQNMLGGPNALMMLRNVGDNKVLVRLAAGATADQEETFSYVDKTGADVWYLEKATDNSFVLKDAVTGNLVWRAFAGGSGMLVAPQGLQVQPTSGGNQTTVGLDYAVSLLNGTSGATMWAIAQETAFGHSYGLLRLSNSTGTGGLDGNGAQILCRAFLGQCQAGGFLARGFGNDAFVTSSSGSAPIIQLNPTAPSTGNQVNLGIDYINSLKNSTAGATMWALAQDGSGHGLLRISNGSGSGGFDGNGAEIFCAASASFGQCDMVELFVQQAGVNTILGNSSSVTGMTIQPNAGGNKSSFGIDFATVLKNGTSGATIWAIAQDGSNNAVLRLSNGSGSGGFDGNGAQIYGTASNGKFQALVFNATSDYQFNGLAGITTVLSLTRATGGSCSVTVNGGIITATTC